MGPSSEAVPSTVQPALDEFSLPRSRRARAGRRVILAVLFIFVAAGAADVFGMRTASVAESAEGWTLEVTYSSFTRIGLATPWTVEITKEGGFSGPITLSTTADFFDAYDHHALDPEPKSELIVGNQITWEFEPPEGDSLTIAYDGRMEPSFHRPRYVTTSILEDDDAVVSVFYRMVVMP